MIDLKNIKTNQDNPRSINDDKFKKLCQSIKEFPKMLELRPIIINADGLILGGNMRYKAIENLGLELKQEWFKIAESLTAEEQRRFIVEDNVGFGEWDWDKLSEQFEKEELEEWGLDTQKWNDIDFDNIKSNEDRETHDKKQSVTCPDCGKTFEV
jgi:ParB-like chromosome segregation protein Spo0J